MERKIGEIFNYQDNLYQCIKSITCTNCGFNNKGCLADKHITGDCSGRLEHGLSVTESAYLNLFFPKNPRILLMPPTRCYAG